MDEIVSTALQRLTTLGIVSSSDLTSENLARTISRAELVTTLVTLSGQRSNATLLMGAPAFTDTQSHWASGYIALAKAMGMVIGDPDGSFGPDETVTFGEFITLLVRFLGIDESRQPYEPPLNYMHAAMDAGILPATIDPSKVAADYVTRWYAYVMLDMASLTVLLPTGKTIYQMYWSKPIVLTVDQGTTVSANAETVTISGTSNAARVMVQGTEAALDNGRFLMTVRVTGLDHITVDAVDLFGAKSSSTVRILRSQIQSAPPVTDPIALSVSRLTSAKIVSGDANGDLRLSDTITRAEVMKILVVALGRKGDADALAGAPAFTDTAQHWASGYVAMAKVTGLTVGYQDGTFRPDAQITYGEVITLIVRSVGLDVANVPYGWPDNYIRVALDAGIVPTSLDMTQVKGGAALRRWVFVMADAAFSKVRLPSGKTVYEALALSSPPNDAQAGRTPGTGSSTSGAHLLSGVDLIPAGAILVAQDGTYLGKVTGNQFDSESICNDFGTYGSEFGTKSIWNEFGLYGGEFALNSPFNEYSLRPPRIMADDRFIAYLTVNILKVPSISPWGICQQLERAGK